MKWCTIDSEYINYLKKVDGRVPNTEYGEYKFKPFFSPLFEKDGLVYVTQISSKKERHLKMKEQVDFIKIYDDKNNKLLGVVNLNFMFPVPKDKIINVTYKDIDKFRKFRSEKEKKNYIYLLKKEMKQIKKRQINLLSEKLYEIVKINPFISKRCLNFSLLEEKAVEFIQLKEQSKDPTEKTTTTEQPKNPTEKIKPEKEKPKRQTRSRIKSKENER